MEVGPSQKERPPVILQSESEMIRYRDDRKAMLFVLQGGENIEGSIRWFDALTIHVVLADRTEITLFKHAVHYYRVK